MAYTKQLPLPMLETEEPAVTQEWGTFKDSLRAPVHNWFTYPAGFSYKAVQASLKDHHVLTGQVVYDPFMGTGTTNVTAKKLGLSSYGVEAHPFVFRIAQAKMNWEIRSKDILEALQEVETTVRAQQRCFARDIKEHLRAEFPPLILKCYEDRTLLDLWFLRQAVCSGTFPPGVADLFFVGLTGLLREVSLAETGWPYIAPKKQKTSSLNKDALLEFSRRIQSMTCDLEAMRNEAHPDYHNTFHHLLNGDSRSTAGLIPDEGIDHVFTSPPYLNNFDYADRTRLELYFFGEAKTWGDITEQVRNKLITSATTQISREDPRYILSSELRARCPEVYDFLDQAVSALAQVRLTRGGKKSYDHLVSGYFNDMFRVISDVFRVLKPGRKAVFVLGDSAPYGVHIPTDELVGRIGVGVGFAEYDITILRTRGDKWKNNPQRHDVALRESIVTLAKR